MVGVILGQAFSRANRNAHDAKGQAVIPMETERNDKDVLGQVEPVERMSEMVKILLETVGE